MWYLIGEIFVCLLIAALIGGLIGWWLRGSRSKEQQAQLIAAHDQTQAELARAQSQQAEQSERADQCQEELAKLVEQEAATQAKKQEAEHRIAGLESKLTVANDELDACRRERSQQANDTSPSKADAAPSKAPAKARGLVSSVPGEAAAAAAATPSAAAASTNEKQRDDLKKVEGIGPKIEQLLNADGIRTWAALAQAEVERLQKILDDAGPRYRIHDPGTWPQQAELADAGKWQELEDLQDRLKGGRET